MQDVTVVDHPLVRHKLTLLRDRRTVPGDFRRLMREISHLLCYEVTREIPLSEVEIETPVASMRAPRLDHGRLVFASILRAGNGLLDGMLDLVPSAQVAHIGLYRDHETLEPVQYYLKVPDGLGDRLVIVVDPMLATAHSAVAAVDLLKQQGARDLRFLCLVAAPEGVETFRSAHPDVPLVTAAVDERLDDRGYIVPGLGDAGDRLFGTE